MKTILFSLLLGLSASVYANGRITVKDAAFGTSNRFANCASLELELVPQQPYPYFYGFSDCENGYDEGSFPPPLTFSNNGTIKFDQLVIVVPDHHGSPPVYFDGCTMAYYSVAAGSGDFQLDLECNTDLFRNGYEQP